MHSPQISDKTLETIPYVCLRLDGAGKLLYNNYIIIFYKFQQRMQRRERRCMDLYHFCWMQ